jgi:hypothetical protein
MGKMLAKLHDVYGGKKWGRGFSGIPPRRKATLGVRINDGNRSCFSVLCLNG